MNKTKLIILLALITLSVSSHLPSAIYSRLNPLWTNDKICNSDKTIGFVPKLVNSDTARGSLITLLATALNNFNIPCDNKTCDPKILNTLFNSVECEHSGRDLFKEFKISKEVNYKRDIDWTVVQISLKTPSVLIFLDAQETFLFGIYDVDMKNKIAYFYDDLGNFGKISTDLVGFGFIFYLDTDSLMFLR